MTKNQKTSTKELSLWVSIYLFAIAFACVLGLVMSMVAANAAGQKHVVLKRQYWSSIRSYAAPDAVGFGTHIESYTVSIAMDYLFWPDGNSVNKVAVTKGSVCYHRNSGNGSLFQGVNANPYWRDDNSVVNIGAVEVLDDNTAYNCSKFTVPVTEREWFRMDQSPFWFATGKVRIKFTNDDDFHFKWGGNEARPFTPGDDPNITDWFYCECAYGGANT